MNSSVAKDKTSEMRTTDGGNVKLTSHCVMNEYREWTLFRGHCLCGLAVCSCLEVIASMGLAVCSCLEAIASMGLAVCSCLEVTASVG